MTIVLACICKHLLRMALGLLVIVAGTFIFSVVRDKRSRDRQNPPSY